MSILLQQEPFLHFRVAAQEYVSVLNSYKTILLKEMNFLMWLSPLLIVELMAADPELSSKMMIVRKAYCIISKSSDSNFGYRYNYQSGENKIFCDGRQGP